MIVDGSGGHSGIGEYAGVGNGRMECIILIVSSKRDRRINFYLEAVVLNGDILRVQSTEYSVVTGI